MTAGTGTPDRGATGPGISGTVGASGPSAGVPAAVRDALRVVAPVDETARQRAVEQVAALATPAGALGRLGDLAADLAAIAGCAPPPAVHRPGLVIAAGDHGVHARGVTPYPQEVTALMVRTFTEGRATANAIAEVVGAQVCILDVGVAGDVAPHTTLISRRVRAGTRDLSRGAAMTSAECEAAVLAGAAAADGLLRSGSDLLVLGDMGIANTTASAALVASFTSTDPIEVTGLGSGIDRETHDRKRAIVAEAVTRCAGQDPWDRLASLGGFEHAALVGVILRGAGARVPVLLDGVIANAAAVAALALSPEAGGYLLAGHRSSEPGAGVALDHLGVAPLLDLDLRLGEGSGALLAVPLVRAASALLTNVATLDEVLRPR